MPKQITKFFISCRKNLQFIIAAGIMTIGKLWQNCSYTLQHTSFNHARRTYDFTSQLYFDDAITDKIHAQAPYAANGTRDTRNNNDDIFSNGGTQLMLI